MIDINRNEISQKNSRVHPLRPQKESRNFGIAESKIGWRETKKIQIELGKTLSKNAKQQDAKNNSELYNEWAKTSSKNFEETIRRGRNRSIKA